MTQSTANAAARIATLRRRLGLNQPQLAALLRVSAASVSRWESGISTPSELAWRQILRVERDVLAAPASARRRVPSPEVGNLPAPLSSFVGREAELATLTPLLTGDGRLLTLTGTGGCGKTRLAIALAAEAQAAYPDGVWFCGLEALSDPDLVPQSLAAALDVRLEPGKSPLDALGQSLRHRRLLLVLDNCEHLLVAAAEAVQRLLRACPGLVVLATSREPLALEGEQQWPVGPLTFAAGEDPVDEIDAVRLFAERARLVQPAFRVSAVTQPAVLHICERLDGLPLAIELAAARAALLTPQQIADRLDDRFRLLAGSHRFAPQRHQTLRAAFDWSFDLLEPPAQTLFARLSVFAGGWSPEDAVAVCGDGRPEEDDIPHLQDRLAQQSLVVMEQGAGAEAGRFRLLESLRAYARRKLEESGEAASFARRHAERFLALAVEGGAAIAGPEQQRWLVRLDRERDNLRAALAWFLDRCEADSTLRMAAALEQFWHLRGYVPEGRRALDAALALAGAVAPELHARALSAAGWLAKEAGDFDGAERYLQRSLAIRRGLDDRLGVAVTLNYLGAVAHNRGEFAAARPLFEESLALFRGLGDSQRVAILLNNVAQTLPADEIERAVTLYEEGLAISRAIGHKYGMVPPLNNLGLAAYARGDFAAAERCYEEGLAVCDELGYRYGTALLLANSGHAAQALGDCGRARVLQLQSLAIARDVGHNGAVVHALRSLGLIESQAGVPAVAARLLGAADALADQESVPVPPAYQAEHDATIRRLQETLGVAAFAGLRRDGARLTVDEAVALVPDRGGRVKPMRRGMGAGTPVTADRRPAARPSTLTTREREILDRLAAGESNKEIARALRLSVRTVERHAANLYAKIGARSKADAIRHALRSEQTQSGR